MRKVLIFITSIVVMGGTVSVGESEAKLPAGIYQVARVRPHAGKPHPRRVLPGRIRRRSRLKHPLQRVIPRRPLLPGAGVVGVVITAPRIRELDLELELLEKRIRNKKRKAAFKKDLEMMKTLSTIIAADNTPVEMKKRAWVSYVELWNKYNPDHPMDPDVEETADQSSAGE